MFNLHLVVTFLALSFLPVALNKRNYVQNDIRTFEIDYKFDQWLRDGQPFRYIAGAMHYFQVPRVYWRDRMKKMAAAGLNAIQTYISWNLHEPQPGIYNFSGQNDFEAYLQLAQELGFVVILRPGPYIDGERDMGGFPYWLLQKNPHMQLRTSDPSYIKEVDKWLDVLLPKIKNLLYVNGGPIITVQVENEYGSYYACDFAYMKHLRDKFRSVLGDEVVLFTTDGAGEQFMKCGKVDGLYATVDFGSGGDVEAAFKVQRNHEPHGPLVNSEFYPGWIDHWGYPHSKVNAVHAASTLNQILAANASVTIYMFEGGTSFGFTNGANLGADFMPSPTSYDFDAPLSEAGDPTFKYALLRDIISQYNPLPPGPVPPALPKAGYGTFNFSLYGSVFDLLDQLCPSGPVRSAFPLSFEAIGQDYGFVLYRTTVQSSDTITAVLNVSAVRDRAHVFLNQELLGIVGRIDLMYYVAVPLTVGKNQIDILVENQGRICYGSEINDTKGLIDDVTLDGTTLHDWEIYSLPLNDSELLTQATPSSCCTQTLHHRMHRGMMHKMHKRCAAQADGSRGCARNADRNQYSDQVPSFYVAEFVLNTSKPEDTFLDTSGWYKGVAFLNGFNLGRYWPVAGPQITLYVPASVLHPAPAKNNLVLFELDWAPCNSDWNTKGCTMTSISYPVIDGPPLKLLTNSVQNDSNDSSLVSEL